jgi:hypothetical protein
MSWDADDFIQKLHSVSCKYIAFEYPVHPHIPLKLFGEIISGPKPSDPSGNPITLVCENSNIPPITSTGPYSVWLRRLFLPTQEINDYLNSVSTGEFKDLLTGSAKNYKIIITPGLATQDGYQYVGGQVCVENNNTHERTTSKNLHPCPYCN